MSETMEDLRAQIRREEVAAGFDGRHPVSEAEIRRRRRPISAVGLVVFSGLLVTTLQADLWGGDEAPLVDPDLLKAAMITLTGGVVAYVVEKEKHLRRLGHLEDRARRLHVETAERLLESAALARVNESLQEAIVLEDVLGLVLDGARDLTAADAAVLHLLVDDDRLVEWARRGEPPSSTGRGLSLAGRVVQGRSDLALSASGPPTVSDGAAMAAPCWWGGGSSGSSSSTRPRAGPSTRSTSTSSLASASERRTPWLRPAASRTRCCGTARCPRPERAPHRRPTRAATDGVAQTASRSSRAPTSADG